MLDNPSYVNLEAKVGQPPRDASNVDDSFTLTEWKCTAGRGASHHREVIEHERLRVAICRREVTVDGRLVEVRAEAAGRRLLTPGSQALAHMFIAPSRARYQTGTIKV